MTQHSLPIANIQKQDDAYNTRQHAFNVGLAYTIGAIALTVAAIIAFQLSFSWFVKGMGISTLLGTLAFSVSLVRFTKEARDIQWEKNNPSPSPQPITHKEPDADNNAPIHTQTGFPSPHNKNGSLWVTVDLTQGQKEQIAKTALQHGKLTINFLTGLGLSRSDAERLREELASHSLLHFNERNEALTTNLGDKSFSRLLSRK